MRTGSDSNGLFGVVWMEQISKVTRLTCCAGPLLVVHMAACHFLCVSGWHTQSHVYVYNPPKGRDEITFPSRLRFSLQCDMQEKEK